jgi:TonB family protein
MRVPEPVAIPEPPKIQAAEAPPPPGGLPQVIPPVEKPKLAFESPPSFERKSPNAKSAIPVPKATAEEAVRAASRPGSTGLIIGDLDQLPAPPGINQSPAPGRIGSNLELLSDPRGVDFKPYLVQILSAVRRNWLAIIPESARLGRKGKVTIQFIVAPDGSVPKLVIATSSGADALDRAAVASISASYPFPRLPVDYRGDSIRLQLVFAYNTR